MTAAIAGRVADVPDTTVQASGIAMRCRRDHVTYRAGRGAHWSLT
ncbi:hypothetical protein [Actinoplanes sp. NPDC049802]